MHGSFFFSFFPKGFPHTHALQQKEGGGGINDSTIYCCAQIHSLGVSLSFTAGSKSPWIKHVLFFPLFSWQCVSVLNMIKTSRSPPLLFSSPPPPPLLFLTHTNSSDLREYGDDDEDHQDTTVNQMLVPRSHQEDATLILNNLLKEYDKTLRPDIGGKDQKWWRGVGGFFGWRRNFGDAVQGMALCLSCPWCWN